MNIVDKNQISKITDSVLLEDPVSVFKICKEMESFCIKHNGVGLSAVQVGLAIKLFIAKPHKKFRYFVNCSYKPLTEDKESFVEGCLSLPGEHFLVRRYAKVKVEGYELVVNKKQLNFIPIDIDTTDIVFQHEIDHQNGVLISDIGKKVYITSY